MKRLLLIAAFMVAAVCAKAQFFNGIELGFMMQYTNQHGISNVGLDITAAKRVAPWSRVRAIVGVNGFVPNGFDRFGYGKVGVTIDVLPFYAFANFGMNYNVSAKDKIGMAFDGGCGLQVSVAKRWNIMTELGIDRINNGKHWQSTASVKAGVSYSL
jgi:hypothetical protein